MYFVIQGMRMLVHLSDYVFMVDCYCFVDACTLQQNKPTYL